MLAKKRERKRKKNEEIKRGKCPEPRRKEKVRREVKMDKCPIVELGVQDTQLGLSGVRDRFGIFGTVTRFRELSLLLVMMLRIPNSMHKIYSYVRVHYYAFLHVSLLVLAVICARKIWMVPS